MLNKVKRHFFSGLIIFVPLGLTIYFIRIFFLLMSQTLLPDFRTSGWVDLPPFPHPHTEFFPEPFS